MKKVKINFTQSDIEQLAACVMEGHTGVQEEVFFWTPHTECGEPLELIITVGDDEEEPYDEDTIDEILEGEGTCPDCGDDGVVTIERDCGSSGREIEYEVKCRNEWHDE